MPTTKMLRAQTKILTYIDMSLVVMFSVNMHKISSITNDFKPVWPDVGKQEKCSSLEPPRDNIYKTQWAEQGVKITRLM